MKRNQQPQWAQVALFSLLTWGTGTAFAQAERGSPGVSTSPADFRTKLQASDRQLLAIEAIFTRVEAAKLPAEKEKLSEELSQPLAAYAKGMIENFDETMKQAELAAKSQGKEGSTALVKTFEDLAKQHEMRMKTLDAQAQKISGDIEKGEGGTKKTSSNAEPTEATKVALGWPMLEKISSFLISPAHAAIAIPVVAACSQANPLSNPPPTVAQYAACALAATTANGLRVQAQTTFNACWNAAHGHKKFKDGHIHVKALMQTKCVAQLVARLA